MDLSKLTPAPWASNGSDCFNDREGWVEIVDGDIDGDLHLVATFENNEVRATDGAMTSAEAKANANFVALARNAFDVMMRRGWGVTKHSGNLGGKWHAFLSDNYWEMQCRDGPPEADDPFTALVEADKWYREHTEKPHAEV